MRKIVIFIPKAGYGGSYDRDFVESYIGAKNYLFSKVDEIPFEFTISEYFSHTFPIDANRNECVSMALNNGIDQTIWVDTDQVFPHDFLVKLLKHDVPIVAGIYHSKAEPFHPIIFKESKEGSTDFNLFDPVFYYPENELFEVDMIGMGCVAIKREVLEKLEKPYFKYREIPKALLENPDKISGNQTSDEIETIMQKWTPTAKWKIENEIHDCSEDVWFWRNVRLNTPYSILIDPTIDILHGPYQQWIGKSYAKMYFEMKKQEHIKKYGLAEFEKKDALLCRAEPIKKSA